MLFRNNALPGYESFGERGQIAWDLISKDFIAMISCAIGVTTISKYVEVIGMVSLASGNVIYRNMNQPLSALRRFISTQLTVIITPFPLYMNHGQVSKISPTPNRFATLG